MPRKTRKTPARQQGKRSAKKVRRPAVLRKLLRRGVKRNLAEKIANQPAKK